MTQTEIAEVLQKRPDIAELMTLVLSLPEDQQADAAHKVTEYLLQAKK